MDKKTLYVDIDSTIWDLEEWCVQAVKNQYGVIITEHDIDSWDYFKENFGPDWWGIFEEALDPARIPERELFPNCAEALQYLVIEHYMVIHFLSHNPKPDQMHKPIFRWLSDKMYCPFNLTIFGARNDKVDFMKADSSAWGIVEDKGKTLKKADDQGFYAFGKRRSANQKLQNDDNYGIIWFDDWSEMPELIDAVVEGERLVDEQLSRRFI